MLTVHIAKNSRLEDKLKSILDTAEIKGDTTITIMVDSSWHYKLHEFMMKHDKIDKIKMGNTIFFVIKHMRVEIKPIDFYI